MNPALIVSLREGTLDSLLTGTPGFELGSDRRRAFLERLADLPVPERTLLDSFRVERGPRDVGPFSWSAEKAARRLSTDVLRREMRVRHLDAAFDEVVNNLTSLAGDPRTSRDLGSWLASLTPGALAMVRSRALHRAHLTLDVVARFSHPVTMTPADSYLSVARSRWLLRGQRDAVIGDTDHRILLRVRPGAPSRSAVRGLRVDALIDTLANPCGQAPACMVGVWPESGLVIGVEMTLDDLRGAARDLLRTARLVSDSARQNAA